MARDPTRAEYPELWTTLYCVTKDETGNQMMFATFEDAEAYEKTNAFAKGIKYRPMVVFYHHYIDALNRSSKETIKLVISDLHPVGRREVLDTDMLQSCEQQVKVCEAIRELRAEHPDWVALPRIKIVWKD